MSDNHHEMIVEFECNNKKEAEHIAICISNELAKLCDSHFAVCNSGDKSKISKANKELNRATKTLENAGYTDNGGELWKPPLGPSASPMIDKIDSLTNELEALRAENESLKTAYKKVNDLYNLAGDEIHYPECFDTAAYPTLADAIHQLTFCGAPECKATIAKEAIEKAKKISLNAAKKWFYESFEDDLLQDMERSKLIAQAEGFSLSCIAELQAHIEGDLQNYANNLTNKED